MNFSNPNPRKVVNMYSCWYCHRPIVVGSPVQNILTDTIKLTDNVRMAEHVIECNTCRARYTIEVYLDAMPTISSQMLAMLDNTPHK